MHVDDATYASPKLVVGKIYVLDLQGITKRLQVNNTIYFIYIYIRSGACYWLIIWSSAF